ncbi:MAG: hypothetical protein AAF413_01300 [Patescibacteria group bacterium]
MARKKKTKPKKQKLLGDSAKKRLQQHYEDGDSPQIIRPKTTVPLESKTPKEPMLGSKILEHKEKGVDTKRSQKKRVKLAPLDLPIDEYSASLNSQRSDSKTELEETPKPNREELGDILEDFTHDQETVKSRQTESNMKELLTNLEGIEGIPAERSMSKVEDSKSTKEHYRSGDYKISIRDKRVRPNGMYVVETIVILSLIMLFIAILIDAEIINIGIELPFDVL